MQIQKNNTYLFQHFRLVRKLIVHFLVLFDCKILCKQCYDNLRTQKLNVRGNITQQITKNTKYYDQQSSLILLDLLLIATVFHLLQQYFTR